jgi:hypothetical protein
MESLRLWQWDNRLKLLLMVTLVYAFLLSLLRLDGQVLREWLLHHWCHRTGKRYREFTIPLPFAFRYLSLVVEPSSRFFISLGKFRMTHVSIAQFLVL